MPGINFEFSVVDKFSQSMNKFERQIEGLENKSDKLDKSLEDTNETTKKISGSADKAGLSFGGFGASMLIVNQALQAFQRLSEPIKQALDDIADKERAIIQLGKEAGEQFNEFARDAANAMGRTESEIRKAGFRWRETGIGGSEIMEMTELADRFANLNPGRSFEDVANALNDAVKSKSTGSLAELLGGGEGVERKLLRSGVERSLKRGDVSGAMDKFKEVADGFGYTQKRADEMGMTIDRKIEKITSIVRNKFTEMFSGIVSRAEPFIDKILGWLASDDATVFFDRLGTVVSNTVDLIVSLSETVGGLIEQFQDSVTGFFDGVLGESVSFLDLVVGLFVGGITQLGGSIWNIIATIWDVLVTMCENGVNGVIDVVIGFRNGVVTVFHKIKTTVTSIFASLVSGILGLAEKLEGTKLGEKLGLDDAAKTLREVKSTLDEISQSAPDLVDSKKHHVDLSRAKLDTIDSTQRAADNIGGALSAMHKFFNLDGTAKKDKDKNTKALENIKTNTDKIRSAMSHEQDLRWMKEMAEQRFINEVNVRQLTPTVNVKVSGTDLTPKDIGRYLNAELTKMADAGTFNAYGEVG
jgi:methyl-accepting chemotaxis protein